MATHLQPDFQKNPRMSLNFMTETNELSLEQKGLFRNLTRLQQKTTIGVLGGLSQTEAYRQAGGGAKTDKAATTCSISNVI